MISNSPYPPYLKKGGGKQVLTRLTFRRGCRNVHHSAAYKMASQAECVAVKLVGWSLQLDRVFICTSADGCNVNLLSLMASPDSSGSYQTSGVK